MNGTKIKLTSRVRRGLADVRRVFIDALDDTQPPASTTVAKWTKQRQNDVNQALAWLEQNEAQPAAEAKP